MYREIIQDSIDYIEDNIKCDEIQECTTETTMLNVFFPLLLDTENAVVSKCSNKEMLNDIAIDWIEGKSYAGIEQQCIEKEIRLLKRGKAKIITLQDVIKFCEDFLGYDCTLILAAVIENIEYYCGDDNSKKLLKRLSKRMRYGLASQTSIILYEMGFNDRVVATEIAEILDEEYVAGSRKEIVNLMKRDSNIRKKIECKLQQYPTYFFVKYKEVI